MLSEIVTAFRRGDVIPYLGPGVTGLPGEAAPPSLPEILVQQLVAGATVPHKIRNNLTAASQYIENFKHRKTLTCLMAKAFAVECEPSAFHKWLATQEQLPLIVHAWYDDLVVKSMAARSDWGLVQGVTQSEHFGDWVNWFRADLSAVPTKEFVRDGSGAKAPAEAPDETLKWRTLVYEPLGAVTPASNFIVSDSDYVEVLTEIDIQTPIPDSVQTIRKGRNFLFLGCRFTNQLERSFARQIMKRSSDTHWALIEGELTRNEEKFLREQNIQRIDAKLADFAAELAQSNLAAVAA
ncbi:SIR2 family protein [Methylocystis sp. JR02]|uniref:SIR2 family NAD-dependent protein deacylase n=1 Tax=Methylocystis sp. JR02 TaxID=3046284 RepID=UPI0024B987B0|nr:SIR2 family protein [Methylocystis sp. JR02]MDJ0447658.1 SIR2 family protein [Methylocystis sp. JR02]